MQKVSVSNFHKYTIVLNMNFLLLRERPEHLGRLRDRF